MTSGRLGPDLSGEARSPFLAEDSPVVIAHPVSRRLACNKLGDTGVELVAMAAKSMPHLEAIECVEYNLFLPHFGSTPPFVLPRAVLTPAFQTTGLALPLLAPLSLALALLV